MGEDAEGAGGVEAKALDVLRGYCRVGEDAADAGGDAVPDVGGGLFLAKVSGSRLGIRVEMVRPIRSIRLAASTA